MTQRPTQSIEFNTFLEIYNGMNNDECRMHIVTTLFPYVKTESWEQMINLLKLITTFDDKLKIIPTITERNSLFYARRGKSMHGPGKRKVTMKQLFDLFSFATSLDEKIRLITCIEENQISFFEYDHNICINFMKTQELAIIKSVFKMMYPRLCYIPNRDKILEIIAESDTEDKFIQYCKIIKVTSHTYQNIWNSVHKTKDLAIVETHENKPNVVINNVSYCVDFGIPEIIGESFVNEDHSFGNVNTTVIHHILNKKVHCIRSVHKYRLNVKESCVMRGFTVMNKNIHTVEISGYKKISVIAGDSVECKLIRLRIYRNLDTSVYVYDDIIECYELRLDNKIIPDESLTISIN